MDKHYDPLRNAQVTDAVMRYCCGSPRIEISLRTRDGGGTIRFPATEDRLGRLWDIFHMDRLDELNGQYCRAAMDPETGEAVSITGIIDETSTVVDEGEKHEGF